MTAKNIVDQMHDLHEQALLAQIAGIKRNWKVAKAELDKLYEMADCAEADIAKHPTMSADRKADFMREIEQAAWAAHLPIKIEVDEHGKLSSGEDGPKRWKPVKI